MKDPFLHNLAERFADHTMDVDPGTWSAISGKLVVANGSSLSELLQDKFDGHEAQVDPQVWTNISSQLGHGAAAGVGSTAGWWAAGIAATLVAGSFLLYTLSGEPAAPALAEKAQVLTPTPTVQEPVMTEVPSESTSAPATVSQPELDPAASTERSSTLPSTRIAETPAGSDAKGPEDKGPAGDNKEKEGEKTVNTVLQDIVDNYVTSPIVVVTEPKVPPPTQDEMPDEAVHPQHEEPEVTEDEPQPEIRASAPEISVMIPTAFSPNSDGVNDELAVTVQNYQKALVRIFSASNNMLVFSADNLEAKWNGTVMNGGQLCEPGMYFYALEVTDESGRTWSKAEVVRLFRQQ